MTSALQFPLSFLLPPRWGLLRFCWWICLWALLFLCNLRICNRSHHTPNVESLSDRLGKLVCCMEQYQFARLPLSEVEVQRTKWIFTLWSTFVSLKPFWIETSLNRKLNFIINYSSSRERGHPNTPFKAERCELPVSGTHKEFFFAATEGP